MGSDQPTGFPQKAPRDGAPSAHTNGPDHPLGAHGVSPPRCRPAAAATRRPSPGRTIRAAALLDEPPVLLFDEPVNGLDPEGALWVRGLFRRLAAEGRTVFVSSRLMSETANTADQLVVTGADAAGIGELAHRHRVRIT